MSTVKTEQILVVPTELFRSLGYFQGFSTDTKQYLDVLLDESNTSYRLRDEMENDPSFKQLIPYVIFRHIDAEGRISVLRYTRGSGQGETRLHSKQSIGIGGHISDDDSQHQSAYLEGMRRELEEEVVIESPYSQQCVGMINDDTNEVGKVHLGIVHIFDVDSPNVSAREDEMVDCNFVDVQTLLAERDRLETWSQICVEQLFV